MKKLIYSLLLGTMLLTSCTGTTEGSSVAETIREGDGTMQRPMLNSYKKIDRSLAEDDFSFLEEGMSFLDVISEVGEENGYVGSGMLSPFYELDNESWLCLGFDPKYKHLQSVWLYYPDGTKKAIELE